MILWFTAVKQVPAAEYNPFEFIKTNVIGTQNLMESCLDKVGKVIALSMIKRPIINCMELQNYVQMTHFVSK